MPVSSSIDKQRRLILTVADGCVKFDAVRAHQDRLLADCDFDATFDQLIDTTPAAMFDLTPTEAKVLAQRRIFSPKSRRAFVAAKPHIYGLGRMIEIYHEDIGYAEVEVFHSVDEALKWLNCTCPIEVA
jgi:hypothetical protein